jgi:hypothetical protein
LQANVAPKSVKRLEFNGDKVLFDSGHKLNFSALYGKTAVINGSTGLKKIVFEDGLH